MSLFSYKYHSPNILCISNIGTPFFKINKITFQHKSPVYFKNSTQKSGKFGGQVVHYCQQITRKNKIDLIHFSLKYDSLRKGIPY